MTNQKIENTIERAIQSGYCTYGGEEGLKLQSTIESLCDEVDGYRAKINSIEEDITADILTKKEKQALESAKKKMLAIYETLTPEETRAWEMGEVYAEIVRGLE